jgi:hypothetical protein
MKRFEIYKNSGSKAYSICAFEDGISHYPYAILCTDSLRRGIDFIGTYILNLGMTGNKETSLDK